MPKQPTSEQTRRGKSDTATVEISKELRRSYKVAAVRLDMTMRELIEEVLRGQLPQIRKRVEKAPE